MKTISIIFQSSYALLAICLGAVGYIYVVHGLGGDSVMGVLALAVIAVFATMLYKLGGWFVNEALPQLEQIAARRRAKHKLTAEASEKEAAIAVEASAWEEIVAYTKCTFKEFLPEREIEQLILALESLREGGLLSEVSILRTLEQANGLTITDLFHYGWNVWARIGICNRRRMCSFLIRVFPNMLGHITVDTIYAKMTKDYGVYTIPLIPREEALC